MEFITSSPSYLSRNPYSFCFRIKVPKDLRPTLQKRELKYSLKTGNLSNAKTKARFMAANVHLLFRDLRRVLNIMDLSDVQIKVMLQKFLRKLRDTYDEPNLYSSFKQDDTPIDIRRIDKHLHNADDLKEYQTILDLNLKDHEANLALGIYSDVEEDADSLLIENGILESDIDKASIFET